MFSGRVSPRFEPLVPVELVGSDGRIHEIEVVLDTGFDGELSLPAEVIHRLGFPVYDDFVSTLANGRDIGTTGWEGQIMWHGRRRNIVVLETEGSSLMGMWLLWRNRITIENYANGPVLIEELA